MIEKLQYISQQNNKYTHLQAIENACKSGCKWIQLRIKNEPAELMLNKAAEAKKLCNFFGAKLVINDFPEVAKAVSAHGVHLGLNDTPLAEARNFLGDNFIIGGTANTYEHVLHRVKEGADYIGLGPFRFTATKEKLNPVLGLEGYRSIMHRLAAEGIRIPVIAIGGIEIADVKSLMEMGVYGAAVSGSITHAADRVKTVKEFYEALNGELV